MQIILILATFHDILPVLIQNLKCTNIDIIIVQRPFYSRNVLMYNLHGQITLVDGVAYNEFVG